MHGATCSCQCKYSPRNYYATLSSCSDFGDLSTIFWHATSHFHSCFCPGQLRIVQDMRAATLDIELGRGSAVKSSASLSGSAAERDDFLRAVVLQIVVFCLRQAMGSHFVRQLRYRAPRRLCRAGPGTWSIHFCEHCWDIKKGDNKLLFVFVNRYCDDSRRLIILIIPPIVKISLDFMPSAPLNRLR